MQGTPNDLVKSGVDFAELLEQDENEQEEENALGRRSGRSSSRSLASSRHTLDGDNESDNEEERKVLEEAHRMEATSKGTVKGSVAGNYMKSSGSYVIPVIIIILFILTQFSASFADFWVSFWTKQEELRSYYENHNFTVDNVGPFSGDLDLVMPNETFLVDQFNSTLNETTVERQTGPVAYLLSTDFCMSIHGILIIAIFVIGITRSVGFFGMAIRASQNMHDGMFKGLINVRESSQGMEMFIWELILCPFRLQCVSLIPIRPVVF